ncbi:hypothetical protein OV090_19385 [Nannocystis sp. RBIL2]|uniref:hypothetical protein n=1 Tax=Nannocystis sp. RBIL2 TaxID=2996788 RepID=UPI00227112AD|nr:hypothetical protein [Nannocystis sp. RBIL2]MCY1066943.1 hypothetical protein [Nannocystis sp. RBIL2]
MFVPLPQAFAVDRGSIRGWPGFATATPRSDDPRRSGLMAPSSAAGTAGTSSSGASSEISPTLARTPAEASEYDDCPDDPGDVAGLNAALRELDRLCIFKNQLATDTTDEDDRACVLDCSNDATCPEGKVCADPPCLRPAP